MYRILVILILASALSELRLNKSDFAECRSRECFRKIGEASKKVLRVNWKPISVFPEEAKRFR